MRERYDVINGSMNGKELSVSTKKNPERKFQTETHTVIGKAAGDFQNQQKIQKNDREQRLAGIYYNNEQKTQTIETLRQTIKEWDIS